MTRETIRRQLPGQPSRAFVVTYLDDVPERAEALASLRRAECEFHPADPFPKEVDSMVQEEAQGFLDRHPVPRLWDLMTAFNVEGISDSDLERIRLIPELKIVRIISDRIPIWLTLQLSHAVLAGWDKQKRADHRHCAVAAGSAISLIVIRNQIWKQGFQRFQEPARPRL